MSDNDDNDDDLGFRVFLDKTAYIAAYPQGFKLQWVGVNDKREEVHHNAGYYATIQQTLQGYVTRRCRGVAPQNIAQLVDFLQQLDSTIKDAAEKLHRALNTARPAPSVDQKIGVSAPKKIKRRRAV